MSTMLSALLASLSLVQPLDPGTPSGQPEIRAMSFNIRYGTAKDGDDVWPNRRAIVIDTIRRHAPEILGVQEALAFQIDELEEAFPHFQRLGQGRRGKRNGEYAAVFFDTRKLTAIEHGDFWLSETPDQIGSRGWDAALPRICTWVKLSVRGVDRTLTVWNAHFDHRGREARRRSAELIAMRVAGSEGPDIVMGDLNSAENSKPLSALKKHGLLDTFRQLYPDAKQVGTFSAFSGKRDGAKIDYVLVDDHWTTVAAQIVRDDFDGRFPSDHYPVSAVVRLKSSQ